MDGNAQNMYHGQGDAYYRYDPNVPRGMGPPPGYSSHAPRHRAPIPLQQQQSYPTYQPTDNMYSMNADQHTTMSLGDITGWGTQPVPPQPYGQPMSYGHPAQQTAQRQPQASYRQHMAGYPQDPKQMQAAYSSQQNMMGGMIPQQGYGSIAQSSHQQQAQQRIAQHYPQSGHQMYPTPPQHSPAPQPYGGYSVQHQNSRSSAAQHPVYGHAGMDQASYGHLANQGPVGLPPIGLQQSQQSHLGQATQSHQQQQQLHQLQHPTMNPAAPLVAPHGNQTVQTQQQSHLNPQVQHGASTMHHSASSGQHQTAMGTQGNQSTHQLAQSHNLHPMPHQMGHGMLPSYGNQAPTPAAPTQVSSYLPNSKQSPATQQHGNSPQYRAPFPQLSPQMSPRPQMSPHPQMSPRPSMSPAKPPQQSQNLQQSSNSQSPHPHIPGISSPSSRSQPTLPTTQSNVKSSTLPSSVGGVSNTLQALEQMVMPISNPAQPDYNQSSYRQQTLPPMPNNPLSPLGSRGTMSPQHQQQQWPSHLSQLNGNNHHMLGQSQLQMQQHQMQQGQQSASSQMMSQLPDLMSGSQTLQVVPPPSSQHQQQSSYSSYDELTDAVQKPALESIHKPYENLSSSLPSQQMGGGLMNSQMMSPTLQSQNQQQQAMETQDSYGSLQATQQTLSGMDTTDQSSELNMMDSYSSNLLSSVNVASAVQKTSNEDSIHSQNTNDNSQCSQVSDNSGNLLPANNFAGNDDETNQQSLVQDLPCLTTTDCSDDFQKSTGMESEQNSQESQEIRLEKCDVFGLGENQSLNPKIADSTIVAEKPKDTTVELTNFNPEVTNNIAVTNHASTLLKNDPPVSAQMPLYPSAIAPTYNSSYNLQQQPYTSMPHHQERAMLQQQMQELYLLPAAENQEKIHRIQERISILQQHETNEACLGGNSTCVLQNPVFSMIDSPQVTSTTGRGRGRGSSAKPRKPRAKKSEKLSQALTTEDEANNPVSSNLPVSEDSVTAGTGLSDLSQIYSEDNDVGDTSQGGNTLDLDTSTDASGKKIKKPRKPRAAKPPKEPKERKKKGKDSQADSKAKPKRDASSDAGENSASHDNNSAELSKHTSEGEENQTLASLMHNQNSTDANSGDAEASDSAKLKTGDFKTGSDEVTDFDDIPVSKIPIKSLLEEKNVQSDDAAVASEDHYSNNEDESPSKKKRSKSRKSVGLNKSKRSSAKSGGAGKSSRRSGRGKIVQDSGDEGGDDMITTPPVSPTGDDADIDSSKRRSARNTSRKKYSDDVMMRFSDDEIVSPLKRDAVLKSETASKDGIEGDLVQNTSTSEFDVPLEQTDAKLLHPEDISNKPNYVYINTTDEDTMIVQFVLAQRMGKRELKPEVEVKKEEPVVKTESDVKTETDGLVKEESTEEDSNVPKESSEEAVKTEDKPIESESAVTETEEAEKPETEVEKMDISETPKEDDVEEEEKSEPKEKSPEKDESVVTEEVEPKVAEAKKEDESSAVKTEEKPEPVFIEVEEFLVKYRNFSYLHCEWRTEDELLKGDKRVSNKIRRFQQKQGQQFNIFENIDEDPFNPDFVECDRILDCSEHTDDEGNTVKHYLVKWKSLPYEDSTWELEEDIDEIKIEQFERFNKLPPKSEWKFKRRPPPDQWKQLDKTPVYKGGNTLRPYQLEGLNWLKYSWFKGNNCILADEMGLGKTIQSLTFVHSVWEFGIRGPFLVIAPLSTIPNWQREFESWTEMNVIVYHGSSTSRQMLNDYEIHYKLDNGKPLKDICKFNVLITTFEMIVTDHQDLKNYNFRVCVIDEAHRLKNRNCKLLEGLRQLNLEHRVLLSGTPLQNNVNELFSLLNFLEPSQFSNNDDFLRDFGSLKTESEVQKLQALLKPMMLRRLKDDVEKSLAPKEETIVEVELTNIQKKYYRGILEQNFSFLQKGTTAANIPNLMNTMMELRKCCIHPYLLNGAEEQIQYEWRLTHGEDRDSYYKNIVNASGKMVLIDKLLPKLKANGHRVLIFSQMVRCLDILEDYLVFKKYPFERIDGRIRGNLRQAAIDRYSKPDSDRFVFLLCTKAGGLGINLTAADTVIIYDSDWNPQNDLQAQARCHRIGQQKMVKIYRLLCRNTYEREMFDKASLKLGLDKAILQSMNTTQKEGGPNKQMSKKEIEDLLKKGAYGAVMDDDNAGDKFCEEDIDSILQRRTQIITMESEKGSTFSKASFASSGNRSDINIDDPDFWNKWAKRADIDTTIGEKDETENLVLDEPRRRTQIKRYGHDDGVMDMSEESTGLETDEENGIGVSLRSKRRKEKLRRGKLLDEYIPRDRDTLAALGFEDVSYGSWARSECFKVEKGLLSFGWGRWSEILEQGAFKRGWKESDVEDCSRVILLFCLQRYQGDEKIKTFIWDLIKPRGLGEDSTIARNHSGLHNLVPRGRNAKGRKGKAGMSTALKEPSSAGPSSPRASSSASSTISVLDDGHWSKDDKYDADSYLDINYKKHLTRHANKVLLRVRMLYYIKHEIIGDYVHQIQDGVQISDLPIRPPPTTDQMPCSWWNPKCCDKSLLVGTYKHGCESYRQMRADPSLCYISHCGPGSMVDVADDVMINKEHDDETNSKHGDDDEEIRSSKDGEERPSSSGLDDEDLASITHQSEMSDPSLIWPSMQDLNTRLRRVITSYQRNYKKEELKQQQKAKLQSIVQPGHSSGSGSAHSSASTSYAASLSLAQQQQQQQSHSKHGNQIPSAADISLLLSLGMGGLDASQLANLDLQKLAMYLKMERREKIEQVVRERERTRFEQISKKWTRRDEIEFLRVLTGYGIDLQQHTSVPMPDWSRFKTFAKLDKKSDENLSDYYKVFIAMCKRQAGEKLLEDEKGLDGLIDEIGEDHAKLILDRLELLSKLREIAKHPKLEERLKLCENNLDTPDWWEPGKHDRELIKAVLKYGLYRSDQYILNDTEFPFAESEKLYVNNLELLKSFKFDNPAEMFKLALGEGSTTKPEVSAEVPEAVSKTPDEPAEKVREKTPEAPVIADEAEVTEKPAETQPEDLKVEESKPEADTKPEKEEEVAKIEEDLPTVATEEQPMKITESKAESEVVDDEKDKMEVDEDTKVLEPVEKPEEDAEKIEESQENLIPAVEEKPTSDEALEPEKEAVEARKSPEKTLAPETEPEPEVKIKEEPVFDHSKEQKIVDTVVIEDDDETPAEKPSEAGSSKKADELRARFPDLEVFQPLMKLKQLDAMMKGDIKDNLKSLSRVFDTSMVIKWFRDFALEKRVSHIIYCVEKGIWPVGKSYSAYSGCLGIDLDLPLWETVKRLNHDGKRSSSGTPDVITITTDHSMTKSSLSAALQSQLHQSINAMSSKGKKGQKRHIAIDVETERAKLHALLNNTTPIGGGKSNWNDDEPETGRRSGLQPPPAHQPSTRSGMSQYKPTVTIPGTSSTLTPIDLSSSLPKMRIADILRKPPSDMSEVQDFSMGKSKSSSIGLSSTAAGKGKLNDMLTKLMKKNNVPMDEPQPPLSKEKKRRKLDEIVLGLSAAKQPEQKSIFGDPGLSMSSKKPQIQPSVSVTPANIQSQSHSSQNQKPFTITVTSVPGKSSSKGQSQSQSASGSSGMAALQSMSNLTSKESMNAMILQAAQAEQQAFLKQQQKIIQSIPANSPQRKAYEAMFSEMKQALELSSKLGSYGSGGSHDAKVNKWLAEQTAALTEQALSMEYLSKNAFAAMGGQSSGSGSSSSTQARRGSQQSSASSSSNQRQRSNQSSSSQSQSQAQAQADANAMANINWNSLTGEESVSVIHKSTGKRLSGRSAPQLKRLSQWLKENPMYEIDPKWTESLAMPSPSVPHSSSSSMNQKMSMQNEPSYSKASMSRSSNMGSSSQYGSGHASSSSSSSASGSHKKQPASSSAASNLANFQGLTGLNANLLSSLPGLGNFDPKNPLSSIMPFAGMPGLGSMGNMNNLNNMNLFGNIAALGGLAGMDAQSLAAVMAAASLDPSTAAALAKGVGPQSSGSQSSSNKSRNKSNEPSSPSTSQHQSSSSKQSSSQSAAANAANLANSSGFPFFFPNPSLLYTPLGLSGLNPYSLPGGISAYDQLAQQCNLLNGGALSGAQSGTTSTMTSSRGQNSSSKNQSSTSSSASRGGNSSQSTPSPSNKGSRSSSNMNSLAAAAARDAQLQSLLLPHDTHLLESLSRATGLDITQSSSRSSSSNSQEKRSNAAQQANKDALEKLERDRRKLLEQLTRNGFPTDFATMQALAKMPAGLGASSSGMGSMKSSKDLPVDFSQALFAEMMAQTAAAVSTQSSSKRSRDQDMKDALDQLSKNPVEMLARSLGVGPGISLIPTSSASSIHDAKKMRRDSSSSSAAISLTPTSSKISDMKSLSMSSEELKSPRSSRTESSRHHDQQDKITLTPVSAASIGASLPSQTTISLSTSGGSGSSSAREREASQEHSERHSSPQRTHQPPPMQPSSSDRDGEVSRKQSTESLQQNQQHDPNMDIEDLIAQSKVSKGGELQQEEQHNDQRKSDDNSQDQNEQQQDENTGDEGERRTARRTRSKRPRSGDDVDVSMPERKRELRSSAGRLAAAAAARMAAEAKMAAQQAASVQDTSLNLSNSSDGSKDDGNAE